MSDEVQDLDWAGKKKKRANLQSYVRQFLLYPDFWSDPDRQIKDNLEWHSIKFHSDNELKIPTGKGVYCFVVVPPRSVNHWETKYLFYIGKASSTSLRSRFKNYLNEKRGIGIGDQKSRIKVEEMLNDFDGHIQFYYATVAQVDKIKEYEDLLLRTYMPYVNTHQPEAQINEEFRHIY